jgi:hypothetical protein
MVGTAAVVIGLLHRSGVRKSDGSLGSHSVIRRCPAQCPVCPEADTTWRFMITRPSQAMAAIDHDYVADVLNRFRPETRRYMHSIVEPPITKRSTIRQSELLADALRAIDRDRAD